MIKTTPKIMRQVLFALILGIICLFYFLGFGVIWQILLGGLTAIVIEAMVLKLRQRHILSSISDGSALITGVLLAVSIPSIAPWWLIVLGTSFAIIFGKQLYGGLGHNIFNPAMLGYVFLLIAYPLEMTHWQSAIFLEFRQSIEVIFLSIMPDVTSSATLLDRSYTGDNNTLTQMNIWLNITFLLGGLYLWWRGIIEWQIPVAVLSGMVILSGFLWILGTGQYQSILFHLTTGATMLGAFFIATDPVSSSTTPKGRLIYGFGVGVLVVIIRELSSNYPDGVAFAVLLMNMLVPMIDSLTKPKILG